MKSVEKVRAIILSDSEAIKSRVYDKPRRETLAKLYGCSKEKTYTKSNIKDSINDFTDVEYIFATWGMPIIGDDEIRCFPKLKAVFYAAGTVKYFAQPLFDNGIRLFSAWVANGVPVAEFTFAQIVLANKGYYKFFNMPKNALFAKMRDVTDNYNGNFDTAIGLIGMGTIGRAVAEKCKSMRYKVMVYDPYFTHEEAALYGVEKAELHQIFSCCDVISNHLPNLDELEGIINKSLLSLMKPYATFINTGRGRQVNEQDLVECMNAEKGRVALLDVTYPEPPPADSPLFSCENIFITPHIAGSMNNEVRRLADYMIEESIRFENNEPLLYEITQKILPRMA